MQSKDKEDQKDLEAVVVLGNSDCAKATAQKEVLQVVLVALMVGMREYLVLKFVQAIASGWF